MRPLAATFCSGFFLLQGWSNTRYTWMCNEGIRRENTTQKVTYCKQMAYEGVMGVNTTQKCIGRNIEATWT